LETNYLSTAISIGDEWPKLGTWGSGATVPEFELQPPKVATGLLPFLSLRDVEAPQWGNLLAPESVPWGAGLCVRREIAEAYCSVSEQSIMKITDRKGKSLVSCGDAEISIVAARRFGLGTGIFPQLKVLHIIPKERVSVEYLLNLYQANRLSVYLLLYNWDGTVPRNPVRPRGLLSMLKNSIMKRGLERRRYFADIAAMKEARRLIVESQQGQVRTDQTVDASIAKINHESVTGTSKP
jgi:hypothetical protein